MLARMSPRASDPAGPTVASRHHPLVAACRALARGDDRTRLLLDGLHLVSEALDAALPIETLVFSEAAWADDGAEWAAVRRRGAAAAAEVVRVTATVLDAMSPVRSPSGVLAIAARPHRPLPTGPGPAPLLLVAVDVQDPGNLGAIVRTAEAGGATGVIVAGATADPFSWKALRGSMGSALRLPIEQVATVADAIARARALGCRVLATMPRAGRPFTDVALTGPIAFLLGGEGPGLTDGTLAGADEAIAIPMATPVESLNVAVAAALLVFEARRQRDLP